MTDYILIKGHNVVSPSFSPCKLGAIESLSLDIEVISKEQYDELPLLLEEGEHLISTVRPKVNIASPLGLNPSKETSYFSVSLEKLKDGNLKVMISLPDICGECTAMIPQDKFATTYNLSFIIAPTTGCNYRFSFYYRSGKWALTAIPE